MRSSGRRSACWRNEEGYTSDEDADAIDDDALLTEVKASTTEANEERVERGDDRVELVGWASPPRYEKESHTLFWAKELAIPALLATFAGARAWWRRRSGGGPAAP